MANTQLALLLAGTLVVPQITAALGNDSTVGVGSFPGAISFAGLWGSLGMPAIPHIETTAWMQSLSARDSQVDTLWGLKMDTVGPFLVQSDIPGSKFSKGPKMIEPRIWTE